MAKFIIEYINNKKKSLCRVNAENTLDALDNFNKREFSGLLVITNVYNREKYNRLIYNFTIISNN